MPRFQSKPRTVTERPSRRRGAGLCPWGILLSLIALLAGACQKPASDQVQGYVEGEFVYVAAPSAGRLQRLFVERGQQVKGGDPLFDLDDVPEKAARDEAERRLLQAQANLEDARKGRRPAEIEAVEAQLKQAKAAVALSEREYSRQQDLLRSGTASKQEFDRVRATRDQDQERVAQLEAELKTARLGARSDQIAAAEADVKALEARLARAEWDVAQKHQVAPQAGAVFDTFYREGEWVAAGRPVVALLPPRNIKVRAFVSEERLATIHRGDRVEVSMDGVTEPLIGKVSFISPQAEYTPPVIYSRESRGKLVFMIEAVFDSEAAARLHPGQPVDVRITAR